MLGYFSGNEPPWPGRESQLCDAILARQESEIQRRLKAHLAEGDTLARRKAFVLAAKSEHRFASAGGRPTTGGFPCFNLEQPGGGMIVVGWPVQWSAQFTHDAERGLRVRAGQKLTHFKLRPGEEVRTWGRFY